MECDALALVRRPEPGAQSVAEFWRKYGEPMRAENRAACEKIANALEDDWSVATEGPAEGMLCLWYHDVQQLCEDCGGKRGWAVAVEDRLGSKFKRMESSVPSSAQLAVQGGGSVGTSRVGSSASSNIPKLSMKLLAEGTLSTTSIPRARLLKCLVETKDPSVQQITREEKSNIIQEVFSWRAEQKAMGLDKGLTKINSNQLNIEFPYHPGAPWKKSLRYMSGNRGRSDAAVRAENAQVVSHARPPPHPLPSPPHHIYLPQALYSKKRLSLSAAGLDEEARKVIRERAPALIFVEDHSAVQDDEMGIAFEDGGDPQPADASALAIGAGADAAARSALAPIDGNRPAQHPSAAEKRRRTQEHKAQGLQQLACQIAASQPPAGGAPPPQPPQPPPQPPQPPQPPPPPPLPPSFGQHVAPQTDGHVPAAKAKRAGSKSNATKTANKTTNPKPKAAPKKQQKLAAPPPKKQKTAPAVPQVAPE